MKTYSDYIVDYDKYGGFDVVLVCQNQLFHTHRLLLSAGSSFLSAILKSCGFEDDVVTILLPDFEPAQVKELVNILYNRSSLDEVGQVPQLFSDLHFNDVYMPIREIKVECELAESVGTESVLETVLIDTCITEELVKVEAKDDEASHIQQDENFGELPKKGLKSANLKKRKEIDSDAPKKKRMRRPKLKTLDESESENNSFTCEECRVSGARKNAWHFLKEENYMIHMKTHYCIDAKDRFPCDKCKYVSHSMIYLKRHILNHHTDAMIPCKSEGCDQTFKSNYFMQYHFTMKHKDDRFICDSCPYVAKQSGKLKLHQQRKHEGVRFICDKCGHEAVNPDLLKQHIKTVHESIRYPCDKCDYVGLTYSSIKHHEKRRHAAHIFLCEKCSFSCGDRGGLNSHVKRVHTTKIISCAYCEFTTKIEFSLRRHQESKHKREIATICKLSPELSSKEVV